MFSLLLKDLISDFYLLAIINKRQHPMVVFQRVFFLSKIGMYTGVLPKRFFISNTCNDKEMNEPHNDKTKTMSVRLAKTKVSLGIRFSP